MAEFHYACLVEAGDVLYDAGDSALHGEVAEIVAEYSTQSEQRRSFLHGKRTVSYLLDMAIVFVLVSDGDSDTRLIFLVLEEIKKKFRDPDRPLHFEETLKSIMKAYNLNMDDLANEEVRKIRDKMEQMPTIRKETIEMAVPLEELDELNNPDPIPSPLLSNPDQTHLREKTRSSQAITAVLIVTFVCITLFVALIVWSFESRDPTPDQPTASASSRSIASFIPKPLPLNPS